MHTRYGTVRHAIRVCGMAYLCYRLIWIGCFILVVRMLQSPDEVLYATQGDATLVPTSVYGGGLLLSLAVILVSAVVALAPRHLARASFMVITALVLAPFVSLGAEWLFGSYLSPLPRVLGSWGGLALRVILLAVGPVTVGFLIPLPRLAVFMRSARTAGLWTAVMCALAVVASFSVELAIGYQSDGTRRVHHYDLQTDPHALGNTLMIALITAYCFGLVRWWAARDDRRVRPTVRAGGH